MVVKEWRKYLIKTSLRIVKYVINVLNLRKIIIKCVYFYRSLINFNFMIEKLVVMKIMRSLFEYEIEKNGWADEISTCKSYDTLKLLAPD